MKRTLTAKDKASVFELWKNGEGFSEIAKIMEFTAITGVKVYFRLQSAAQWLKG